MTNPRRWRHATSSPRIHDEPDPRRKLHQYATVLATMLPRTAPIQLLLREAAADPSARELLGPHPSRSSRRHDGPRPQPGRRRTSSARHHRRRSARHPVDVQLAGAVPARRDGTRPTRATSTPGSSKRARLPHSCATGRGAPDLRGCARALAQPFVTGEHLVGEHRLDAAEAELGGILHRLDRPCIAPWCARCVGR